MWPGRSVPLWCAAGPAQLVVVPLSKYCWTCSFFSVCFVQAAEERSAASEHLGEWHGGREGGGVRKGGGERRRGKERGSGVSEDRRERGSGRGVGWKVRLLPGWGGRPEHSVGTGLVLTPWKVT